MKKIFFISIMLLVYYQHMNAQGCPDSVFITGTYEVPYTGSHNWIQSIGETKIPSGANVILDANPNNNGYIKLNAGFSAAPGSVLKAVVMTPCALSATNHLSLDSQIQVFPNPNNGNFIVELPIEADQSMVFRINDFVGRLILEKSTEIGSNKQTVAAEQLPEGLYFLQIVVEGKVLAVKKFVKQ